MVNVKLIGGVFLLFGYEGLNAHFARLFLEVLE
jgi:hypothetical protein